MGDRRASRRSAGIVAVLGSAIPLAVHVWRFDAPASFAMVASIIALPTAWSVATGAVAPRSARHWSPLLGGWIAVLVIVDLVLILHTGWWLAASGLALVWLGLGAILLDARVAAGHGPAIGGRPGRILRANRRLVERIGRPVGALVGFVAMVPGAVIVTVLWGCQRLVGVDPLQRERARATGWTRRQGRDAGPARAFSVVPISSRPGGGGFRRALSGSLALVVLVGGTALGVRGVRTLATRGERCAPLAGAADDHVTAQQADWVELACAVAEFARHAHFDAVTTYAFDDHRSRLVNETDGRRRTWTPPPCGCRRVTLWWFGGSAAWGTSQRDDETVASELAKAAWRDGVALDVVNFAIPGWTMDQGVRRFGSLLATEPVGPDLAVFYGGGDDLLLQEIRNRAGRGRDATSGSVAEDALGDVLANGPFSFSIETDGRRDVARSRQLEPSEVERIALRRYSRGVDLARRYGVVAGAGVVVVFQPTRAPLARPGASLPDGVVDLSGLLADARRPAFVDRFDVAERAAPTVAAAILGTLRAEISDATATGQAGEAAAR